MLITDALDKRTISTPLSASRCNGAQSFGIVREITPQLYAESSKKPQTCLLCSVEGRAIIYSPSDFRVASNGGLAGRMWKPSVYCGDCRFLQIYSYFLYSQKRNNIFRSILHLSR